MKRRAFLGMCVVALVGLVSAAGCSSADRPEMAKVSGRITYKGKPVEGAEVSFHPTGESPRAALGHTDSDGRFQLTTFDTNDGAVLGEYIVTVQKAEGSGTGEVMDASDPSAAYDAAMRGAATESAKPTASSGLPVKYVTKDTSPEKRTVTKEGPNEFNIELQD